MKSLTDISASDVCVSTGQRHQTESLRWIRGDGPGSHHVRVVGGNSQSKNERDRILKPEREYTCSMAFIVSTSDVFGKSRAHPQSHRPRPPPPHRYSYHPRPSSRVPPFQKCPDELILDIIRIAVFASPTRCPIRYAAVCSRWRSLVQDDARLWTSIHLGASTSPYRVKAHLELSGRLSLNVSTRSCPGSLFKLVESHFERVADLQLNDVSDFARHWGSIVILPAHRLVSIRLKVGFLPQTFAPLSCRPRLWPNLVNLFIQCTSVNLPIQIFPESLRTLSIDWVEMASESLYEILSRVPRLERLQIMLPPNNLPSMPLRPLVPPSLPALNTMSLKGSLTDSWLNSLVPFQTPRSSYIHVEVDSGKCRRHLTQSRITTREPYFAHTTHLSLAFTDPVPMSHTSIQNALNDVQRWTRPFPHLQHLQVSWANDLPLPSRASEFQAPILSLISSNRHLMQLSLSKWKPNLPHLRTFYQSQGQNQAQHQMRYSAVSPNSVLSSEGPGKSSELPMKNGSSSSGPRGSHMISVRSS